MPLLPVLWLLASASTIAARAITTDASSIPDFTTTSFITSVPTHTTIPGAECYDIRYCRTLEGLVQSCIVTILACVWFAVHRNIPAPRVEHPHDNFFVRTGLFVWYKILDQRQAFTIFMVTLLVPEWVLAWALRQFLMARKLSKELEKARKVAARRREEELSKSREAEKEVNESVDYGVEDDPAAESSGRSTRSEQDRLIKRQVTSSDKVGTRQCKGRCEKCGPHCCVDDVRKSEHNQIAVAERVQKASEGGLTFDRIYRDALIWTQNGR